MSAPKQPSAASPRGATPAVRRSRIRGVCLALPWLLAALAGAAQAQLFPDNEARKAILELRATDEQQAKRLAELAAANKELLEQVQQLRRNLLDFNNQLEALRTDLARQRGSNEQLARDVAELQRRQKDIAQGVDDRIRKLEPQTVAVDGKEFLADAEEKRSYDEAFALLRAGDFAGAASALNAFAKRYPASGYLDSVRFWLGNAQYGKREYKEAITSFRGFIAAAPEHSKVPEALLAIANCQAEMKDSKAARVTLNDLLMKYPQSEAAQAGKERLAALK
jgi:tol-pal system protein YbgF